MQAIRFENVRFSYDASDAQTSAAEDFSSVGRFALDGVDFSVEEGEFVAVLGHNGSGKSTLARLTNGLLSPTEGKITVFDMDAADSKNLFEIRKSVGIVFQNPDNQTVASIVEDDVAFGPENIGLEREEIGARIAFALGAVGMEEFRHATPSRLSGGQKQRIAIAGVLALKPRIIILDEATAMLDPRGRKEVMEVVQRLNREENITVLFITHFPEEAMLADRAIVMHEGKIVMQGKPFEVLCEEEKLKKYSLSLPAPIKLCRALKKGGLEIEDTLSPQALAENIASATVRAGQVDENFIPARSLPLITDDQSGAVLARGVRYIYNERSPFETHALNGVDLEIKSGEFFGIIGYTGSGKSTFVQHLNALIKLPTAEKKYRPKKRKKGEAELPETVLKVAGYDLTDKNTDFKSVRKSVGMVFQYPEYQLFAETVFADVAFGLKNFSDTPLTEAETAAAVKEALETVGLDYERVKDRSPFELSGGQKRRVAIAGVIVTKPRILVLDEPAAGLDPLGKTEIMKLLHRIHGDWCKTVIVVSHDMDEIAENCTRAAIFSGGKVLAAGTPKQLFGNDAITAQAGLDIPYTAKVSLELLKRGIAIDSDYTRAEFTRGVLRAAKARGAKEGEADA
ncbi:MAG: energy-coupling factor transporter ATPase [Clostridia bacterium]|nr:energy-coupling factor transporter ATPase [Clostridia bacterium]